MVELNLDAQHNLAIRREIGERLAISHSPISSDELPARMKGLLDRIERRNESQPASAVRARRGRVPGWLTRNRP
jgi:hypothetical protein